MRGRRARAACVRAARRVAARACGSGRCAASLEPERARSPVRTRPLSGIAVGRTTSNAEMRSRRDEQQPVLARVVELAHLAGAEVRVRASGTGAPPRRASRRPKATSACSSASSRSNARVERVGGERRADVGVGGEQVGERQLVLPRAHRVALHDLVGALARQARLDQRQQHAARERQAERAPRGSAACARDTPACPRRPRRSGRACSRRAIVESTSTTRSAEECEMSRSCQSGDVLEPTTALRADHAGEPRDALAHDRVALVRHRRRALLAAANGSSASRTSVRCRWRISVANRSSDAADHGQRREEARVPVARDDLRRRRLDARGRALERDAPRRAGRRCRRRRPRPTACRRRRRRARRRGAPGRARARTHQPSSFRPKVVGSACTPWVRPMHGVERCSSARAPTAAIARSMPASSSSPASRRLSASAVSTTSDDVSP